MPGLSLVQTQPYFGGTPLAAAAGDGWSATEVEYDALRNCRRHAHRRAFMALVLAGGYAERMGTQRIEYGPFQLGFHPEATEHADEIPAAGTRILIAEFDRGWLEEVSAERLPPAPAMCSSRAAWLATTLVESTREGNVAASFHVESTLCEILATLKPFPRLEGRRPGWMRRVTELIREEFDRPLTIKQLARQVDLHPVYLSRAFRKYEGVGLGEYLMQVRVAAALRGLSRDEATIADVALEAGFCDQSRLTRVLRAHTGATPGQIRRSLLRLQD